MPNKLLTANTAEKSTKHSSATAVASGRVWSGSLRYKQKGCWQLHLLSRGPRSLECIPFPWFKIASIWCTSRRAAKAICLLKWGFGGKQLFWNVSLSHASWLREAPMSMQSLEAPGWQSNSSVGYFRTNLRTHRGLAQISFECKDGEINPKLSWTIAGKKNKN